MAQTPPDPTHILHNPSGPVTALTTFRTKEGGEETLVSGSNNGAINIWNLNVYRSLKTWQAHSGSIAWLGALDDRPGYIISQARHESLIIWNEKEIAVYRLLVDHEGFCKCDLWTNIIAIPAEKNSVHIFDINETSSLERTSTLKIDDGEGALMAIKLLGQGSKIATAYESGCICIWNENIVLHRTRVKSMPTCLGHHVHRNELLLGTSCETLYIFNADNLTELKSIALTNPGLNVMALRLSDLRIYATAGWDKRIRLFSARSHKKLCVLQLHDEAVNSLIFIAGPGSGLLAAGGSDALISLWDVYNS